MNDERLTAALRSLPREQARPGFTGRVLRRLDEDRPGGLFPARWAWTAAAAAVLTLALSFGWRDWRQRQEQGETLARLEALLVEKQALEAELASLRRLTAEARPVVYLGGNDRVELVLDIDRFQRRGGFGSGDSAPAGRGLEPWAPQTRQTDLRQADLRQADLRQADLRQERYETLRVVY